MTNDIKMGTIMIEGKTFVPNMLFFESERISADWIVAKNLDRHRLERRICDAGGAFVPLRHEFKASVCGFDVDKTTRKAIRRLLLLTGAETVNCLEVIGVDVTRFLGLLYVRVSARAWRIMENAVATRVELPAA